MCFMLLQLCCVYAQLQQILFKPNSVQYKYRDSFLTAMTNSNGHIPIKEMEVLCKLAADKEDDALEYGFRLSIFKARILIDSTDAVFEKEFVSLVNDIEGKQIAYLDAEALHLLARYYWSKQKYTPAFEYYTKAHNIYNKYGQEEFPQKIACLGDYGGAYYHFKDYANARKYFIAAVPYMTDFESVSTINTIGLCFTYTEQYDSATYYYNIALERAKKYNRIDWVGILSGNIGYMLYAEGKYDQALPYLQNEIDLCLKQNAGELGNTAKSLALLSSISLSKNNKEEAMRYAMQAYNIYNTPKYRTDAELTGRLYPFFAKAFAANGDKSRAYDFLDISKNIEDSLAKKSNALMLAGAQHNIDAERHLVEITLYKQESRISNIIRNSLIAGIAMLAIIGLLFINRQRLKYKHRQALLESEKQQTEAELGAAKNQLVSFTNSISEKNELLEKVRREADLLLAFMKEHKLEYNTDTLIQLQHTAILTDEAWVNFQYMFEKVHKGFLKRLKNKAVLTPIEVRFVLLSKLRMSDKEMAAMLGISAEAAHMNRQRIQNKLGLAEDAHSLEHFADTI